MHACRQCRDRTLHGYVYTIATPVARFGQEKKGKSKGKSKRKGKDGDARTAASNPMDDVPLSDEDMDDEDEEARMYAISHFAVQCSQDNVRMRRRNPLHCTIACTYSLTGVLLKTRWLKYRRKAILSGKNAYFE